MCIGACVGSAVVATAAERRVRLRVQRCAIDQACTCAVLCCAGPHAVLVLPACALLATPHTLHLKAGGEGDEWVVLLASGIRGVGGAVLRFKSKHFTHGMYAG